MLREIKAPQRSVRVLLFRVDGSVVNGGTLTTDGLLEGKYDGTITENSSGNYTITFAKPFARIPVVSLTPVTDVTTVRMIGEPTALAVTIEQVGADQKTPEADADFHVVIHGFDAVEQNG